MFEDDIDFRFDNEAIDDALGELHAPRSTAGTVELVSAMLKQSPAHREQFLSDAITAVRRSNADRRARQPLVGACPICGNTDICTRTAEARQQHIADLCCTQFRERRRGRS